VPDDGNVEQAVSVPLSCVTEKAGEEVAAVLGIGVGDPVIHVERLLHFNGKPVVLDQIYLVAELFPDLSLERLSNEERSLYSLFENDFGVRMIHAEERLRAVAADQYISGLLAVTEGAPLLLVERTAYSYGNKPVEWRRGFYCTNRHHYRNDLG
jgi:GntR family transcriptional regulator